MTKENSLNSFYSLQADEIMYEQLMLKFLQQLSMKIEIDLCFYPETLDGILDINRREFYEE